MCALVQFLKRTWGNQNGLALFKRLISLTGAYTRLYFAVSRFKRLPHMPAHSSLAETASSNTILRAVYEMKIMNGSLATGVRIVEGKWAQKFGVAQGSIREAINILAVEGFVSKESGSKCASCSLNREGRRAIV